MVQENFNETNQQPFMASNAGLNAKNGDGKAEKNAKLFTVITYFIALACLLAGLLAPLFNIASGGVADKMLVAYALGVVNVLANPLLKKDIVALPKGFFKGLERDSLIISYPSAIALAVFMLTCVLGLIMIAPVLAGNKSKRTYKNCAYAVEVLGALSSGFFVFSSLRIFEWGTAWQFYNFIIAFGGILLVLCVQSIYEKGGLAVTKIILLVLSALTFLLLLNPAALLSTKVGGMFDKLSATLKLGDYAVFDTIYTFGFVGINFVDLIKVMKGAGMMSMITYLVGGVLVCMLIFNFGCDLIELATGRKKDKNGYPAKNKAMNVTSILRYSVALLLAVAYIVLLIINKDHKAGLLLYAVTLVTLIQLVFAIVRAGVLSSKHNKAEKADKAEKTKQLNEQYDRDIRPSFDEEFAAEENDGAVSFAEDTTPLAAESAKSYVEAQPEAVPQAEPVAQPEPEAVPETEPVAQPEPEAIPEAEPVAQPEPEAIPEAEPVAQPEPEAVPQAEPFAQPEPQPAPQPIPQPAPQPAPQSSYFLGSSAPYTPAPVQTNAMSEEQLVIPGMAAPAVQENRDSHGYVYTYNPKYEGPTDKFMDTLTDAEKIEFVQLFLEKTKGRINGVPDYKMGEDNGRFFSSVFVHINRSREVMSTQLLEKIYKQVGKRQ